MRCSTLDVRSNRMMSDSCEPGVNELTFQTLRALMTARLFWGVHAALGLPDLCSLLSTSEASLRTVLYALFRDGWIARDEGADTIGLTRRGVRHFMSIEQRS